MKNYTPKRGYNLTLYWVPWYPQIKYDSCVRNNYPTRQLWSEDSKGFRVEGLGFASYRRIGLYKDIWIRKGYWGYI